jgi:oxygen-dependent protoporphyrinogen oxidase
LIKALRATRGSPAPGVVKPVGGNSTLTDALAERLGDKLRLGTEVSAVASEGGRWRVRAAGEELEAERLVLALPSAGAARLLAPSQPALARAIGSIPAESLVSVAHVHRREDVAHPLDGFGYLVSSREGLAHLGTLFSSRIDPGSCPGDRVLLRTMAGGARRPEVVDLDDAALRGLVAREVGPLLGLRAAPLWTSIQRWRATLPRFDLRHPERLEAIERARPVELGLLGNWLGGIGVNHLVAAARTLARTHTVRATA